MTEDQRRALAPLLFEIGPMLEIFSDLEEGDASHYTPALHLGLTEWRRITEAFQPLLGVANAVPLSRCTGGQVAPIEERFSALATQVAADGAGPKAGDHRRGIEHRSAGSVAKQQNVSPVISLRARAHRGSAGNPRQPIGTAAMAEKDYTAMAKEDYREYHQQLAARLRSAAEHSTTKAIKARLVAEAEQHERIVRGETEIRAQSPPISSAPSDTGLRSEQITRQLICRAVGQSGPTAEESKTQ
jgi:hypothetical protein